MASIEILWSSVYSSKRDTVINKDHADQIPKNVTELSSPTNLEYLSKTNKKKHLFGGKERPWK